jgi:hypothetical protein
MAAVAVALTVAEAVTVLDPPLTELQLRQIVRGVGLRPCGKRRTGRAGPPAATYDAAQIIRLHAAISPFLESR